MTRLRRVALASLSIAALASAGCTRVTFAVANLPALFAPRMADQRFGDGPRDRFDVYRAATPAAGPAPRPLVVFFYGGNFTMGSKSDYRFVGAALARTGHVTVVPDYRVYPPTTFPGFVEDAARAVVAAQASAAKYGADGRRVVLAGHSAGAFIAAQLAFEPRWLAAAGGDPRTIVGFIGLSGPYDLDPNSKDLEAIFDAVSTPDEYRPLRHVRAGAPPSLLLHGDRDDVVGVQHSERMAQALRAVNAPVTLTIYPGRGHADTVAGLSLPARRRTGSLAAISAFLRERDVGMPRDAAAMPVSSAGAARPAGSQSRP
jgi:acetyl esterase/lipase